jgi:hypothetical protein
VKIISQIFVQHIYTLTCELNVSQETWALQGSTTMYIMKASILNVVLFAYCLDTRSMNSWYMVGWSLSRHANWKTILFILHFSKHEVFTNIIKIQIFSWKLTNASSKQDLRPTMNLASEECKQSVLVKNRKLDFFCFFFSSPLLWWALF